VCRGKGSRAVSLYIACT